MNILAWRKWAIVWMVAVLSGFQLRAADPVVAPVNMEPLTIEGNRFVIDALALDRSAHARGCQGLRPEAHR